MARHRCGTSENRPPRDHYTETTDRVIAALETGTPPWRKPWDPDKAGGGVLAPRNGVTGRKYRGINAVLLAIAHPASGSDPRWMTFGQAAGRGWRVQRGARGTRVFLFRPIAARGHDGAAATDEDAGCAGDGDDRRRRLLLRAFTVFHASQVEGAPAFEAPIAADATWRTPETVDAIIRDSGIAVREGGGRAYYAPVTDHVQMPPRAAFRSAADHAATLLHEAAHATGHPSRLARDLAVRFGSEGYAREELHAELASCFLGGELGLPCDVPNHASYLADWLEVLRGDKREIFRAAADAQRIADWLLAFHPEHAVRLAAEARADDGGDADADETAADDGGEGSIRMRSA